MRYQTFTDQNSTTFPIAFLAKRLDRKKMQQEFLDAGNLVPEDVITYEVYTPIDKKKANAAEQREYLEELLPTLQDLKTKYLVVTDPEYFKTLTGSKKAEAMLGYVVPNAFPASMVGQFQVLFCPHFGQVFHNPGPTRAKIKQALDALADYRLGVYQEPGHALLTHAAYPESVTDIKIWLQKLMDMDVDLSADIEAFSLHHVDAGVGTISFAWNEHEGIAFAVDLGPAGKEVRYALKTFFIHFEHKIIWHNISYDVTVLVYQLFMKDIIDTESLLEGLEIMLKNWECTKIISYLATNSCAGNKLSLKDQAQEFAGNYAVEEINDITKIPLPKLLEYNLVDACSTWYVYKKHWPTLVADEQEEIYKDLFQPVIWDIIQMQLTGLPLDMKEVAHCKIQLEIERDDALDRIQEHPAVKCFVDEMNQKAEEARYQDWLDRKNNGTKVREYTPLKNFEVFKPNSPKQLQELLYEFLDLPVMDRTDTKQPATGAKEIGKLRAYTEVQGEKDLINALLDFKAVDKVYGTFIPAMEGARQGPDGWHYLFGSFNLGGTVSGRLSSSNPNLQTIPANSRYAKLIKACFKAPPGWLLVGLDYDSLEDRISALTTKDPNKIKVYTDGFDGHCLRAYTYFGDQMPDINPDSVESINSIAGSYKELRQESKGPTFLLTYQGTYIGIMAQFGFSQEKAKSVEHQYHVLYKHSDDWVDAKLEQATKEGYITGAFGLRVRTPLLAQVVRGTSRTPWEAQAEGRTAGNALGQSWGLLNSRAWMAFMQVVRASKHRLVIRPCAQIHDAGYMMVRDDVEAVAFCNEHLVKEVSWQNHPDIWHADVKLSGALSIFYPSWKDEIDIPNGVNAQDIPTVVAEALRKRAEKAQKLKEAA